MWNVTGEPGLSPAISGYLCNGATARSTDSLYPKVLKSGVPLNKSPSRNVSPLVYLLVCHLSVGFLVCLSVFQFVCRFVSSL